MQYYGTRLSENISKREPEGYLLCLNVPVARTGVQEYLPGELGLPPGAGPAASGKPPDLIPVLRPETEVFSSAAIASFEGMPVTNDHPPEGVDISNIRALQKGHAHNVRRGSGKEADLLLADLIITDPALITAILEEGKREISCGYTYELCEENGHYIQRKIRGNHVAVVDAGRAGSRVSIKDEHPVQISDLRNRCRATGARDSRAAGDVRAAATIASIIILERRKANMKKSLSKALARMARDGDAETVAEIIEEMIGHGEEAAEQTAEAAGTAAPEEAPAVENAETVITVDEDGVAGILERLDRIISLLETPAADEAPEAPDPAEVIEQAIETAARESGDPVTAEISEAMEEILDPVASVILEAEEDGAEQDLPETLPTADALRAALTAVRPVLARMPDDLRRKTAGDIAARIRRARPSGTTGADAYAALASARRRTAPASAELGRRIMEKRNANYKH